MLGSRSKERNRDWRQIRPISFSEQKVPAVRYRHCATLSSLALLFGMSESQGQSAPPSPTSEVVPICHKAKTCPTAKTDEACTASEEMGSAKECPKVCIPKPICQPLFKRPLLAKKCEKCEKCEKSKPCPTPEITVILKQPNVGTPVGAPRPNYGAPQAVPSTFLVPQMGYQMVPVVTMQAVPTMTYGVATGTINSYAAPSCGVGQAPPGFGAGPPVCGSGPKVGVGNPKFGAGNGDLDAEISRLSKEITRIDDRITDEIATLNESIEAVKKRVLRNAELHAELEKKLKSNGTIK